MCRLVYLALVGLSHISSLVHVYTFSQQFSEASSSDAAIYPWSYCQFEPEPCRATSRGYAALFSGFEIGSVLDEEVKMGVAINVNVYTHIYTCVKKYFMDPEQFKSQAL